MNIIASILLASALGANLLPKNNRIVYDHALRAVYEADLAADRAWADCKTPEALKAHQRELRGKLTASFGGFPERTPLNVQVTGHVRRKTYSVDLILFESEPGHHVTGHLYLPDPARFPGKRPGIVVPCGHALNGKSSKGYQRGALQAAERGMVALVYDPIDQGERAQCRADLESFNCKGHNNVGRRAELLGWNTVRFRAWDGIRALDVLAERPEVDATRLGVMGHSGGGTMSAWIMALDDRIRCAAPSGFLSTLRSVLEQCGPQDAEQFTFGELRFGFNHLGHILLRAPSPVLQCASHGDFFPLLGVMETAERARDVYAMLGAPDAYRLSDTVGPHHWHESTRTIAVDWMDNRLQGGPELQPMQAYRDLQVGFDYSKVDVGLGYEVGKVADLYVKVRTGSVTPTGRVIDLPGERTVYDIMRDEAERQREARGALTSEAVRKAAQIREVGRIGFKTFDVRRTNDVDYATLVLDDGTPVPTVTVGQGEPVLFVGDTDSRTNHAADVERLVAAGCRVTVADIRGFGENASSNRQRFYGIGDGDETIAQLYAIVGREFVGGRAEDVIVAARFAGKGGKVRLVAKGRAAVAAAHARFTAPELFSKLELVDPPPAWAELFEKPELPCRFSEIVHGAWRVYDWTDLTR